ncbi:MAG: hypothetical protein ACLQVJ_03400 [Syntrophobacteraceae bacterium]
MEKLSILLAILLFLAIFAASNPYVRAAGAGGAGGSVEYAGGTGSNFSGSGSSGTESSGSLATGSAGSFEPGPCGVQPFYPPGTNTGMDNDKPGLDTGPGCPIKSPSGTGSSY